MQDNVGNMPEIISAIGGEQEIDQKLDESDAIDRESKMRDRIANFFKSQGISAFSANVLVEFLKKVSENDPDQTARLRAWLLHGVNHRLNSAYSFTSDHIPSLVDSSCLTSFHFNNYQRNCPDLVPGLRSMPVWDRSHWTGELTWIHELEHMYPVIKQELLELKGRKPFQPYRAPGNNPTQETGTDQGEWNVFYLFLHGLDFTQNQELCPNTVEFIRRLDSNYNHAFFSAMAPHTHIAPHHGPTNRKLRCHLPLIVPPGDVSSLRVGDEVVPFEEGRCFLFDDSYEHEAFNHADTPRVVLIMDIWHPDLTHNERKFFHFLQKAQLTAAKRLHKHAAEEGIVVDNFMTSVEAGRQLQADDANIWGNVKHK